MLANVLFKFFPFYQLLCSNEQYKWAIGGPQQSVYLIDTNITVFSSFTDGEKKLVFWGNLKVLHNARLSERFNSKVRTGYFSQ